MLAVRPETNFVMIGERCNITGSLKFKRLIKEGNFDANNRLTVLTGGGQLRKADRRKRIAACQGWK